MYIIELINTSQNYRVMAKLMCLGYKKICVNKIEFKNLFFMTDYKRCARLLTRLAVSPMCSDG